MLKSVDGNGFYTPLSVCGKTRAFFAIDNSDFAKDSKDGKGQLHGTLITIHQNGVTSHEPKIELSRVKTDQRKDPSARQGTEVQLLECFPPNLKSPSLHMTYRGTVCLDEQTYQRWDETWALQQYYDDNGKLIPTWKSYNARQCQKSKVTNTTILRLLKTPPTDWSSLYTALKLCQGISTKITPDKKTIVTLDLQLYIKVVQLSSRQDIGDHFVFRMGELHVVFAMCRAIGKYIEDSGLEKLFVHCGIYGPVALGKILEGKHMKRCVSACLIMFTSLFQIMFEEFLACHADLKEELDGIVGPALTKMRTGLESVADCHAQLLDGLISAEVFSKFQEFRSNLNKQGKFLNNVLEMIETMLLFLRGTKQQLWNLHLAALDKFTKYFFALDLQNYARMTPVYLSNMHGLRSEDPETWKFLSENFCCNKTPAAFVAIGVDHCLEQVNKDLKVMGGIVGLNDKNIDKYCLTAPIKRVLLKQFADRFCSPNTTNPAHVHYEDASGFREFHSNGVRQYRAAFVDFLDTDLKNTSVVFNVMSHTVLQDDEELLKLSDIGEEMLNNFITERFDGSTTDQPVSLWDPMSKRKLRIFKTMNKTITIKTKEKVVKLREERGLMTRLLVISRTRTNLDVAELIRTYEFSVVPHALFDSQGNILKCTDKADFLNDAVKVTGVSTEREANPLTQDVLVIDGMGVVNQLKITSDMLTIQQLAESFVSRLVKETMSYSNVVVVFDRYDDTTSNLKKQTWSSRHKEQIQYKNTRRTVIKNIKLKQLLSHPRNKKVLCEILAEMTISKFTSLDKQFLVIHGTTIVSNIPGWTYVAHNQHEADTLLLCAIKHLHHLYSDRSNPPSYRIISPDTDVFILAVYLTSQISDIDIVFEQLSSSKVKKIVPVKCVSEKLGQQVAAALLPAHAFTGSDYTGRFNTITKARALKTLLMFSDNQELMSGLTTLGANEEVTDATYESLSLYTVKLYISKRVEDIKRYSDVKDVASLRWELYSKRQDEGELLPPTHSALNFHVKRANHVSLLWKRSVHDFIVSVPDCTANQGWNIEEGNLVAVMMDSLPAPEISIEMVSCGCKKTKCITNQCSCYRTQQRCSEVCNCQNCENEDSFFESIDDDDP